MRSFDEGTIYNNLNDYAFDWLISNVHNTLSDNPWFDLQSEVFEIAAHPNEIRLCFEGEKDVYFHILGLPSDLELNDIEVNLFDNASEELIQTFSARKKPSVDRVSIQLTSQSKDGIHSTIAWPDSLTIECKLNAPSSNCETKNEQPFINEDSHMIQALDQFEFLLDNAEFSDIKFVVEDKTLHAHKNILAARSTVFSAMFQHRMKETEQSVINIEDVKYEVLKEVLRYIYAGKVNQNGAINEKELLAAADKYDIGKLKDTCEKRLSVSLTTENAIEYLNLAYLHNLDKLRAAAIRFIVENGKDMLNEPGFDSLVDLNRELVLEVIRNLILQK